MGQIHKNASPVEPWNISLHQTFLLMVVFGRKLFQKLPQAKNEQTSV